MNNIDYRHAITPSFASKLIQSVMGLLGVKKRIEKKQIANQLGKNPVNPPGTFRKDFTIQEIVQNGRKVWTVAPKANKNDVVILYLHGGAYTANISRLHWDLIGQLVRTTNATIVVPDYPLAPECTCEETYDFMDKLYTGLRETYPTQRIVFMGDSAGGGLALGFAQQLRNEHKKQPEQLILFSPWLDVSMRNPGLSLIENKDKILSINGLRYAGQQYAGALDLKDYRVSPLYGTLSGLCKISIFIGTNDLLYVDAQECKLRMKNLSSPFHYFEYPQMFHVWMIVSALKESKDVLDKVHNLINPSV